LARVTVRDNAWVLSDCGDFSDPAWRRRLQDRRARMRARLGGTRRPRRLQRAFVETMAFLYDRRLFDPAGGRWRIEEFLDRGEREFGGYDQVIIWQSYPRLGIDERNQFDYYRDMPGGYRAMRDWVRACHRRRIRALVGYNPWDLHTRGARFHLREVAELLAATGADGVYLDTLHAVPAGWPARLEKRLGRPVSFESEGAPAGQDIRAMDSSWGQGWPVHPPGQVFELRWLCPGNKVFLTHHRHRRAHWDEVRCALFTGTGVLVWENVFGNDTSWVARDRALLRAVKPIMREFWRNFASPDWQPLIPAARRRLAVNRWPGPRGTLYTLCWNAAAPHRGPLFAAAEGRTYLDLVTGRKLTVRDGQVTGRVGARSVGAVLEVRKPSAALRARLRATCPGRLPAYREVATARAAPPRKPERTTRRRGRCRGRRPARLPPGTVWVPSGRFNMRIAHRWAGADCYDHRGREKKGLSVRLAGFAMDTYPVTNAQFAEFLRSAGYVPRGERNFLRHWRGGEPPRTLRQHPVVYVCLEDARAYARWAGKRLPTEAEWQYAAGGGDGRAWPWGGRFGEAFAPGKVNGSGRTRPVGSFPGDASPFGVRDLCGHVWQWIDDVYADRVHRFTVLKGGSFLRLPAGASRWYADSGPQPIHSHCKVVLLAPSLDRFSTVGFRCVAD
jgi:formylglycine-generating enzyme required for sulfatase activity